MPATEGRPLQLFISFDPKDRELKEQVVQHLKVIARVTGIEVWTTDRVQVGDDWRQGVDRALERADVALLLISSDFLASDFLQDGEVAQLFDRHANGGVQVIPVLLRSCLWEMHPWLGKLKPLPRSDTPIASLHGDDQDRALAEVAAEIAKRAVIAPTRDHEARGQPSKPDDVRPMAPEKALEQSSVGHHHKTPVEVPSRPATVSTPNYDATPSTAEAFVSRPSVIASDVGPVSSVASIRISRSNLSFRLHNWLSLRIGWAVVVAIAIIAIIVMSVVRRQASPRGDTRLTAQQGAPIPEPTLPKPGESGPLSVLATVVTALPSAQVSPPAPTNDGAVSPQRATCGKPPPFASGAATLRVGLVTPGHGYAKQQVVELRRLLRDNDAYEWERLVTWRESKMQGSAVETIVIKGVQSTVERPFCNWLSCVGWFDAKKPMGSCSLRD